MQTYTFDRAAVGNLISIELFIPNIACSEDSLLFRLCYTVHVLLIQQKLNCLPAVDMHDQDHNSVFESSHGDVAGDYETIFRN